MYHIYLSVYMYSNFLFEEKNDTPGKGQLDYRPPSSTLLPYQIVYITRQDTAFINRQVIRPNK